MDTAPADIQLLVLDVDGVLTDGGLHIDDRGVETKKFHVRDGLAIRLWIRLGYHVAIITGRTSAVVRLRCDELGIQHVFQGSDDKLRDYNILMQQLELQPAETAMLADDLPDLPIMMNVGYPMAVGDAVAEIRNVAEFVTVRPGGHAAVREAIEHLLKAKGEWDDAVDFFR